MKKHTERKGSGDNRATVLDRFLSWFKNNIFFAPVIAIGVSVVAIAGVVDATIKLARVADSFSTKAQLISSFDRATFEHALATAKQVDAFFMRVRDLPREERTFELVKNEYDHVELDLRSLILRNKVRPLNQISMKQSELLLDSWALVGKLLRSDRPVSDAVIEPAWGAMRVSFEAVLRLEAAKQSLPLANDAKD